MRTWDPNLRIDEWHCDWKIEVGRRHENGRQTTRIASLLEALKGEIRSIIKEFDNEKQQDWINQYFNPPLDLGRLKFFFSISPEVVKKFGC